jgi:hypothetical protein
MRKRGPAKALVATGRATCSIDIPPHGRSARGIRTTFLARAAAGREHYDNQCGIIARKRRVEPLLCASISLLRRLCSYHPAEPAGAGSKIPQGTEQGNFPSGPSEDGSLPLGGPGVALGKRTCHGTGDPCGRQGWFATGWRGMLGWRPWEAHVSRDNTLVRQRQGRASGGQPRQPAITHGCLFVAWLPDSLRLPRQKGSGGCRLQLDSHVSAKRGGGLDHDEAIIGQPIRGRGTLYGGRRSFLGPDFEIRR